MLTRWSTTADWLPFYRFCLSPKAHWERELLISLYLKSLVNLPSYLDVVRWYLVLYVRSVVVFISNSYLFITGKIYAVWKNIAVIYHALGPPPAGACAVIVQERSNICNKPTKVSKQLIYQCKYDIIHSYTHRGIHQNKWNKLQKMTVLHGDVIIQEERKLCVLSSTQQVRQERCVCTCVCARVCNHVRDLRHVNATLEQDVLQYHLGERNIIFMNAFLNTFLLCQVRRRWNFDCASKEDLILFEIRCLVFNEN